MRVDKRTHSPSDQATPIGYGYDRRRSIKPDVIEAMESFHRIGLDAVRPFWHNRKREDAWRMSRA